MIEQNGATGKEATVFVDSSSLLAAGDFTQLRERAEEEGHLFFRGLLSREDLLPVRSDILAVAVRHGWRAKDQELLDDRIAIDRLNRIPEGEMRTDIGVSATAYDDVQKLHRFHALPHHPRLLSLFTGLFGREVLVLAQKIARMITAHHAVSSTPPHQDFPHIQGSQNTWTCWFPLGDCPREMGPLTVLRGSHRNGSIPIQPADGAGGVAVQLCPGEDQWVEGDFALGDVLTFPCFTVHKALPCRLRDRMRLSMDVRYQPADEPVTEQSLQPHCSLTWEAIYTGWPDDAPLYYWRKFTPSLASRDESLLIPGQRIC